MDCMGAGEATHRGCSMQRTAHIVTERLREQRGDTEATSGKGLPPSPSGQQTGLRLEEAQPSWYWCL